MQKERIQAIVASLSEGMVERESIIATALLGVLAQQNIFLFGPPGTAKSLIARRISQIFKENNHFEYLMQKFSTPEDVFGPVSIKELKEGNYVRDVDGYLPKAETAFLDEIWKSSPAILNTLLTIINEKKYKNGKQTVDVPLKYIISASNETPEENVGLDALYDRFIIRLQVRPIIKRENFEKILQNGGSSEIIDLDSKLKITDAEYTEWQQKISSVRLSEETLQIIQQTRVKIEQYNKGKKKPIYVSDRRWQKTAFLIKASAFFCRREETLPIDCLVISSCLWSHEDEIEIVSAFVKDSVKEMSVCLPFATGVVDREREAFEKEIKTVLFQVTQKDDVVKGKIPFQDKFFYACELKPTGNNVPKEFFKKVYIPTDVDSSEWRCVYDKGFQVDDNIKVCRDKDSKEYKFQLYYYGNYGRSYYEDGFRFEPKKIKIQVKREDPGGYVSKGLLMKLNSLRQKYDGLIANSNSHYEMMKKDSWNPFVPESEIDTVFSRVVEGINDLKEGRLDCDRLEKMIVE